MSNYRTDFSVFLLIFMLFFAYFFAVFRRFLCRFKDTLYSFFLLFLQVFEHFYRVQISLESFARNGCERIGSYKTYLAEVLSVVHF